MKKQFIISERQDFSDLGDIYSEMSTDGDVKDSKATIKVEIPRVNELGQIVIPVYVNGNLDTTQTFFGSERDTMDSVKQTRADMIDRFKQEGYIVTEDLNDAEEIEDEEGGSDDDTIDENIFDRAKSRIGGAVDAAKKVGKDAKDYASGKQVKSDPSKTYETKKAQRVYKYHMKRFRNLLSDFVTDLYKLGLVEEGEGDKLAQEMFLNLQNRTSDLQNYEGKISDFRQDKGINSAVGYNEK